MEKIIKLLNNYYNHHDFDNITEEDLAILLKKESKEDLATFIAIMHKRTVYYLK